MKLKKSFWAKSLLFLFLFSFFSCASKPVPIPGDVKAQKDNIYTQYLSIGNEYYSLQKYDKAIEFYKLALENKQTHNAAYYKMGLSYVMTKNWNKASEIFKNLLAQDTQNETLQSSLAYIHFMNGQSEESEKIYEKLVLSQPENSDFLENYIAVLLRNQKYDTADSQLAVLKERFPDSKQYEKLKAACSAALNEDKE